MAGVMTKHEQAAHYLNLASAALMDATYEAGLRRQERDLEAAAFKAAEQRAEEAEKRADEWTGKAFNLAQQILELEAANQGLHSKLRAANEANERLAAKLSGGLCTYCGIASNAKTPYARNRA